MDNQIIKKNRLRVKKLYRSQKHIGFKNGNELSDWYIDKLIEQEYKCKYCKTDIRLISELINNDLIKPRGAGKGFRGHNLEIDKDKSDPGYNPENCHLVCYYCNNDKSDTLTADIYTRFFGKSRNDFFKHLAKKL